MVIVFVHLSSDIKDAKCTSGVIPNGRGIVVRKEKRKMKTFKDEILIFIIIIIGIIMVVAWFAEATQGAY